MTNEEREAIRSGAQRNAGRYWEYKTNPFPNTDKRSVVYDQDYKDAGGKN